MLSRSYSDPPEPLLTLEADIEPTQVALAVGAKSASSAASGSGGSDYTLDYMTMGRVDQLPAINWTGKINEAFLSRVNATTEQNARMTQYFEGLYPEIVA